MITARNYLDVFPYDRWSAKVCSFVHSVIVVGRCRPRCGVANTRYIIVLHTGRTKHLAMWVWVGTPLDIPLVHWLHAVYFVVSL